MRPPPLFALGTLLTARLTSAGVAEQNIMRRNVMYGIRSRR